MEIQSTFIDGCFVLKPRVFDDKRGSFFESFNQKIFEEITGLKVDFIQDNQSISKRGVLRGLHFQTGDYTQAKLVRAVKGEVLDVVVDLRPHSKTYKEHFSIVLNDHNNFQLFVPRGFAHGFITLSESAIFSYKCDNYYHKSSESGIIYNDPDLSIDWKLDASEIQLSEKDKDLSFIKDLKL
ncbi:dTDP-4-dehydrorhamnose 3,5-epimerase [Aquimarina sp. EL_43]|uniref:dTDP-4-dehydrorhamnose 3,5-epimerase n=1 Tax=unclassified Aquimarina TaxID=2627091 RepID=UPI0018CBBC59|nr:MULTISPECIES: dTDP-4-dehydrorhamnose 3,5-epimerase [unclassified Aquimarina]MBG6131718.1 dTDP-4-dehydrorhamnose 3,5-epimerase [Aquimarina sp. EL_35]MBG6152179.1 dTDP-4-dehydrorhamnose 3,5-epimerase [Aquimarina sp. EL_32]MBG6169877.1 dTDP-4-dehydrorhamnose 3,5-epimerase [Aquimarina sp. EL_43]